MIPINPKGLGIPIPVLPTVYGDALSYGEQSGKMVAKIEECIDKVNEITDDNNEYKTDLTNQQNTFETNITAQENAFETAITNQQNTYETNLTNRQNTWEQNTTDGLNTWKTNTTSAFQSQITGMKNDYDEFLAEFEQQGEVTQNPFGDNTLLVTSQNAVSKSTMRYNGLKNLLFSKSKAVVYNQYNNSYSATSDTAYSWFIIHLEAGHSYYFYPKVRFLWRANKGTPVIIVNTNTQTPYTLESTDVAEDDYCVTFFNEDGNWTVLQDSTDTENVGGFNSVDIVKKNLAQNAGDDASKPISQRGVRNAINDVWKYYDGNVNSYSNNYNYLLNASDIQYGKAYNAGNIISDPNYNYYVVPLEANTTYYGNTMFRFVSIGTTSIAEKTYSFTTTNAGSYIITMSNKVGYEISVNSYHASGNGIVVSKSSDVKNTPPLNAPSFIANALKQRYANIDNIPYSSSGVNNVYKGIYGIGNIVFNAEDIKYNCYRNAHQLTDNSSYSVIYLYLEAGHTYYSISDMRFVIGNNTNYGEHIYEFTPLTSGYYYITLYNNQKWIITDNSNSFDGISEFKTPQFNKKTLAQTSGNDDSIPISQKAVTSMIATSSNSFLTGKKWCACGDSFTHGDFSGMTDGYTFDDAPYQGQNKVYPYYIGRRCNMNIVNLAQNGLTLAYNGSSGFARDMYQNIPSDSDYITIKIGINDSHQNIPIGTIDDAVDTTFYGAYNIVMSWIIANRPNARVGLIVTNALDSGDYATATIAIAKKYGVPYFNEWNGDELPVMLRSGRTDVAQSVKDARNVQYRVSSTNGHPNPTAHEFESRIIETFLKTL